MRRLPRGGPQVRRALLGRLRVVALTVVGASPVLHAAETAAPAPPIACEPCDAGSASARSGTVQGLPPLPAPSRSFRLEGLRFSGIDRLDAVEVRALAEPYVGRDVTLGDLESLARSITARYRDRGYFLAQAIVPAQTVRDGVVEISVIEGRLGRIEVQVAPDTPIAETRIRAFLDGVPTGQALHAPAYERAMLLLSDQPGIRATSGLQEGLQTGTTDLSVEIAAAPRVSVAAEADNHGTKESGRYRAGGTLRWLSPLGIGDNLDARVLVSSGNALQYGRVAYEAPLGSGGLRAGVGLSRVSYSLGGPFQALDAEGRADVADLSLNYPLIRQRQHNLFLRLSADTKRLTDRFRAVDFESRKQARGAGLGWTWERRDGWFGGGYFASSGTWYRGDLSILDAQSLAFDQGAAGRRTDGKYTKLNVQLSRLQSLAARTSLYLSVGAQRSDKNLDAVEKLSLGGARAVRAYAPSVALVDAGQIGTAELRWSYNDEFTPFVFYDAARGRRARDPSAADGPNVLSLRGYGIGTAWSKQGSFSLNATLAWGAGGTPPATAGSGGPRFYLQLQKVF
jgi:hemolysin activation/secretion protein